MICSHYFLLFVSKIQFIEQETVNNERLCFTMNVIYYYHSALHISGV